MDNIEEWLKETSWTNTFDWVDLENEVEEMLDSVK